MTDQRPNRQELTTLLTDLMRRPRTAEVTAAIAKIQAQIRACPR
jgi:hypothetical protein